MMTKAAERIGSSKIVSVVMSFALAFSMCVAVPAQAQAAESVKVSVGDMIPYANWGTNHMWADGEIAYCADPAAPTPEPGTYSKSPVSDKDLIAAMWFSYGAPGFDKSMFPDRYYDGSSWTNDKYQVASHVLLSYAYQGSKAEAAYGTSGDFEDWARSELLGKTWKAVKSNKGKVSTGFTAYCIHTGSSTQVLMSFKWEKGGLKVVKEDSQAGAEPQGDAMLSGARFDIVNDSGKCALVGGKYYADGEVVKTIAASWDEGAKAYVAKTSNSALPCGTYKVVESDAPEGYLKSDWSKSVKVTKGDVADLTGKPCEDDVIRGGVQVEKDDLELGKSEALGGSSHDAEEGGSTLSGIEFTITNASAAKVCVDGKWYEPGQDVMAIATAWDDEAKAYVAKTAADALPYGTYTVKETKTNDSYLLTDGEPRTFQVREDGKVVTASADGGKLEFSDQVVRNDLEIAKMAEDTNASLQVAFKVTNQATGEAHVVVTDGNGNVSTASSWNKHSANTNGNDKLLDMKDIKASDMDAKAGVWFSLGEDGGNAKVDDGLAALPYGKYLLEELRSDSNEGYDLVKKTFVVERDSTIAKAVWMSLDDKEGPKVQTEAADASDGDHVAQASEQTTISDTVYYENLKADGTEYTVTGTLMVKSTGEALADAEGNAITAAKTFKPKQKAGEVILEFTFDSSLLAGEDVVAFESLVSEGVEVAVHAAIDDADQTVHFVAIRTTATDKADGDKLVTGPEIAVTDEVEYEGLTPGEEYVLEATLVDAETSDLVASGSATFTPEAADGKQNVELSLDGTGLGGKRLVVFEKLMKDGVQLATHEDPADAGQTVTAVEIGTALTDAADGDKTIVTGKVELIDTVEYKGLVEGETYTVNGTLMVKSTGEALSDADGKPVTAAAEFTAKATGGAVEVTFEFDASNLKEGDELVAFEELLTAEGNLAAEHKDIDDAGQTVVIDNPDTPEKPDEPGKGYPKTGATAVKAVAGVSLLVIAGCAIAGAIYAIRKRRNDIADVSENADVE